MMRHQVGQPVIVNIQPLFHDGHYQNLPERHARATILAINLLAVILFNQTKNRVTGVTMTPQGLSGIAENFGIIAGVGVEGELTGGGIAKKGLYGEGCAHNVTFLSRDSGEDLLIWGKSWV